MIIDACIMSFNSVIIHKYKAFTYKHISQSVKISSIYLLASLKDMSHVSNDDYEVV